MKESMKTTTVVTFGDAVTESGGRISLRIDPRHRDRDGNIPTTFPPDTDVYINIFHSPEIEMLSARATDGGELTLLGTDTVRVEQTQQLFADRTPVKLNPPPGGRVRAIRFYGRLADLTTDIRNESCTASTTPVLADIRYLARATTARHRLAAGIHLSPGDSLPIALVIEYRTAS